jgi:arsenate reductase-like glutaredoxin family protein
MAKKFLKENGQSYSYINVDEATRDEKREITIFLRTNNLPIVFPVLVIDERVIQGFNPVLIKRLLE